MVISLLQQIVSIYKFYTHLFVSSWVFIQNKFVLLNIRVYLVKSYIESYTNCVITQCVKNKVPIRELNEIAIHIMKRVRTQNRCNKICTLYTMHSAFYVPFDIIYIKLKYLPNL